LLGNVFPSLAGGSFLLKFCLAMFSLLSLAGALLKFCLAMFSLLSLAGEGGRRPDEGGFIKANAKNLRKNLIKLKKVINILKKLKI
jgi:hypothetical protein